MGPDESSSHFESSLTFDTFVGGSSNRLAATAARKAAESPGVTDNPLFLYAASGLGKSHILSAIAQHSERQDPGRRVFYRALEGSHSELTIDLERGREDSGGRQRCLELDLLLLDDVQFLAGQSEAQEFLLRTLDDLTARRTQVVLASDRPPSAIDALDTRLLSRFSSGLVVEIGSPDYETRVAIMRTAAEARKSSLGEGVAETMAQFPFRNVRELQGALNRVLAVQDLEGRTVMKDDLPELELGRAGAPSRKELSDWLEGIRQATGEGVGSGRERPTEPGWRRERLRPFPPIPEGPNLDALADRYPPLALHATRRLVLEARPEYNPLFVHSATPERAGVLLEAAARTLVAARFKAKPGLISAGALAEELARAISEGVAGAWRERWAGVDVLLLKDIEGLSSNERLQEEFLHLFEVLQQRGVQIVLSSDRPPCEVIGVAERLHSRLEGGLVLDLGVEPPAAEPPAELAEESQSLREGVLGVSVEPKVSQDRDHWHPSPEKVVWEWPRPEDRIVEPRDRIVEGERWDKVEGDGD